MGDGSITPRLGNMKALLGIVAGAGASYGLYKLLSGGSFKKNKKSAANESPGVRGRPPGEVSLQPGSLLAKVSGLDVVCGRPANTESVDVASGEENRDRAHGKSKTQPQADIVSAEKDSDQNKRTEAQTEIKDTNGLDIAKSDRENEEDDKGELDYVNAEEIPTHDKENRDSAHEKSKTHPQADTVSSEKDSNQNQNKRSEAQTEIKDTNGARTAQSNRENDEDILSVKEEKRMWECEEERSDECITEERVQTKVKACKRSGQHEQREYRNCKAGPKIFKIAITRKQWNNIKPKHGKNKLTAPWTDMLYNKFRKTNPSCSLAFTYQHVKGQPSHKKYSSFFCATAKCTFDGCKAAYIFSMKTKPNNVDNKISFTVMRFDDVVHMKNQRRFRPTRYIKRRKIAKPIRKGVSNYYNRQLKKPSSNGYLQYLQINPFAVHLYTDTGIRILAEHLRKTSPVTLHLDATGSVVRKIPHQNKKVLYYALVLPGMGKDKPSLPVTELITNSHSVPSISHWLVEFKRKLFDKSKRQIAQLETDYSWALINSGLAAFNKENISVYFDRAFEIAGGHMSFIPNFTVLHLCPAHIIKAVSHAFSQKSEDQGIKEYATFCFAYLLNCTHMHMALEVFYHMCVLFDAQDQTSSVNRSKTYLDNCVFKTKHVKVEDRGPGMKEEESSGEKNPNGIMAKSPFTGVFQAQRDQAECDVLSDDSVNIQNTYYCPGVISVLLKNYMGIFPLWSGLLLGDLSRHAKGSGVTAEGTAQTPDTTCHTGLWFALVKHNILLKKKYLRPAHFISKMFASLQGRYVEHIVKHNLPLHILDRDEQISCKPDDEHEEHWNKPGSSDAEPERMSKYFSSPKKLLNPKRQHTTKFQKRSVAEDHQDKDAQVKSLWKKTNTEVVVAVIPLQTKGHSLLIHHSELCTLRPHQWLTGEVIGGLFHVAAHTVNVVDSIYLLDHYAAGVILFGDRNNLPRHSLPQVNFENYGAVLSFVLVNDNHWKLLYINAETCKVFLIDPAPGSPELDDSKHAANRIHEYFKMRRTCHAKTDWVDVKWTGGVLHHPFQQDGNNCGVVVVKIAEALMQAFPMIPDVNFHTSKRAMQREREILALKLLEASVFEEHSSCAMCAASKPPGSGLPITDWQIQCDMCARWFHVQCIAVDSKTYEKAKDRKWECPLYITRQSPGSLEPQHLKMLLSCLQTSNNHSDTCQIILTLGNASAFTVNQNLIREFEGIPVIAGFLSDPAADVRVQTLNALNNLCMNIQNQEQIKVYVPQVLELIETSPVNSEVQLGALRLLTNLSVTDKHQHLLKESITLLLSLLVVSNEVLQVQALKVLVNLSSNPDMMDDIVQAQAPASVLLLFDARTAPAVLLRLLTFTGNLKAWRPSAQVAEELRRKQDCLFRVMLDESSQLHSRLVQLLSHPDGEIQAQVARVLT